MLSGSQHPQEGWRTRIRRGWEEGMLGSGQYHISQAALQGCAAAVADIQNLHGMSCWWHCLPWKLDFSWGSSATNMVEPPGSQLVRVSACQGHDVPVWNVIGGWCLPGAWGSEYLALYKGTHIKFEIYEGGLDDWRPKNWQCPLYQMSCVTLHQSILRSTP